MCDRNRVGSRRSGGRSVWGSYPRSDRSATPEKVPTHGKSAQDPPEVRPHYPGGASPTAAVRNTVEVTEFGFKEVTSQDEGDQDVEGGLGESEEFWCTYCGWHFGDSGGESGKATLEYPFRARMEALCAPTACWTARNTSREGCRPQALSCVSFGVAKRKQTSPPGGAG